MPDPLPADLLGAALRASQTLDLARFVQVCVEALGELAAPESVHAYLRSEESNELELRASWTHRRRGARRPPGALDGRLLVEAEDEGGPIDPGRVTPGGGPWPLEASEELLAFPIGRREGGFGVLVVVGGQGKDRVSAEDTARIRAFLAAIGPALSNIAAVRELRETALRDDVAHCYNRRHFDSFLGEEIARARRFSSNVSVLFLDMDNLKEVNSAHGHAMGSRTLLEVSTRINGGIRKIDKLFRFGGDEFCIVLPETDATGAYEVGMRVRRIIAESPLLVPEVGGVRLTASLGLATFPQNGATAEALVQAADMAMQRVKLSGKNDVGMAAQSEEVQVPGASRRRRSAAREDE